MLERDTVLLPDRRGDSPEAGGRLSRLTTCSLFSARRRHLMLNVWEKKNTHAYPNVLCGMTDSEGINAHNSIYKYTSGGTLAKILKTRVNQNDRNVNDSLFFCVNQLKMCSFSKTQPTWPATFTTHWENKKVSVPVWPDVKQCYKKTNQLRQLLLIHYETAEYVRYVLNDPSALLEKECSEREIIKIITFLTRI